MLVHEHAEMSPKINQRRPLVCQLELQEQDRIRELEEHCEALENALAEIKAATFEPKQTLPAVKRRIAKILLAVRNRGQKGET